MCPVAERRDLGEETIMKITELKDVLRKLCETYGAAILDLGSRLEQCLFSGINSSGMKFMRGGTRNVAQIIFSEVYGFTLRAYEMPKPIAINRIWFPQIRHLSGRKTPVSWQSVMHSLNASAATWNGKE